MDLKTLVKDTLEVVDPQGENEEVALLAGMLTWAAGQGDTFSGWDRASVQAALRATFKHDPERADELIAEFDAASPEPVDDEGFDVYLYHDASEEALEDGSDDLVRGFPFAHDAISYADAQVAAGRYARAIVGCGEKVYELYDTVHGRIG